VRDECTEDPAKVVSGLCGCGSADIDSDDDGTLDCNDECPADAAKTAAGVCGCGEPDTDLNSNGALDCLDPQAATIPTKPTVSVNKQRATISMQSFPGSGEKYGLRIKQGKKYVFTKSGISKSTYKTAKLPKGSYKVQYDVTIGGVRSQLSAARSFKVK
jgi:hypothetical protein